MTEILIKDKLRALRESKGLSRETLSKMANVTMQTIFRAETGGNINLNNYLKIIKTLENYGVHSNTGDSVNYI
jgi:DNA-binding XRE family transcriptional regulator